jgi:predicted O-methyltransferase YrrM
MIYDLSHLTQGPDQQVAGPIQDDEALLLFAVCRVTCARRVAEFGGQSGYSAANFLAAVKHFPEAAVYTVDLAPVVRLSSLHRVVRKWAKDVQAADFDSKPLDLVFFDCHDFHQQLAAFHSLSRSGVVTRSTIIALHDTGTHPDRVAHWAFAGEGGFIHQAAERELANRLQDLGYECVSFHAPQPIPPLRYRQGLTLCLPRQRFCNEPMIERGPGGQVS